MILLLSTSDTDLLSARACGAAWRGCCCWAQDAATENPADYATAAAVK